MCYRSLMHKTKVLFGYSKKENWVTLSSMKRENSNNNILHEIVKQGILSLRISHVENTTETKSYKTCLNLSDSFKL